MSEFTENYRTRIEQLTLYAIGLMEGRNGKEILEKYKILETKFLPGDILALFDILFERNYKLEDIKTASNKLFNILFKTLSEYKRNDYKRNSILHLLAKDNSGIKKHLTAIRKDIRLINKLFDQVTLSRLKEDIKKIEKFTGHYVVMENVVFPEIERNWNNHQCLKLMWSFHDDIRKNIKNTLEILEAEPFDLKLFNQTVSKVYFTISTIIFREEHVLFPILAETLNEDLFNKMANQLHEFELLFADVQKALKKQKVTFRSAGILIHKNLVSLSAGELTPDQVELIFNHLPVDVTYVDENNRVKYFSTPSHRIFPRTTGIIGRRVQDCHPHESVDVVNRIVESFRSGEKDDATFWIRMGGNFILIRYFAVRDKDGIYKGVLEVSQNISGIQEITGERRLLDW
jgi:DUF438 domain-containing protein